jgi:hypothetical protein
MISEKSSQEILEGLRVIIGQHLVEKPHRRDKPVSDPALWRAIENQQRFSGSTPYVLHTPADNATAGEVT